MIRAENIEGAALTTAHIEGADSNLWQRHFLRVSALDGHVPKPPTTLPARFEKNALSIRRPAMLEFRRAIERKLSGCPPRNADNKEIRSGMGNIANERDPLAIRRGFGRGVARSLRRRRQIPACACFYVDNTHRERVPEL